MAELALSRGCEGLISFGLAGGLDPDLPTGTLILADAVIANDGLVHRTHSAWFDAVVNDLQVADIDFIKGTVIGVDDPLLHTRSKELLFSRTGAVAVDMESHSVMRVARHRGIPWIVIRAVADKATDNLPAITTTIVEKSGRINIETLIREQLRNPKLIYSFVKLWWISRRAFECLRRVAVLPSLRRTF